MTNKKYFYVNPAVENLEKYLRKRKTILRKLQSPLFKDIVGFIKDHKTNKGKGYVVGPMGSGKTVIFTELIKTIGQRAIVCVPTTQLLLQTQAEFALFAPLVQTGLVDGWRKEFDADVIITTHASLVININNGKLNPKDFNWLILDEVHEMLSAPRIKIVHEFKHAITIGFTASDKYDEEKEVAKLLPTEIHRITIVEGVEGGLLCPFSVMIAETTSSLSKVRTLREDYSLKELERAVNTEARNRSAVALYEKTPFFRNKSLMCHCVSTNHADAVAKKFRMNGWKAEAIHHKITRKKQEKLIERFLSGDLTILCNVKQLTRGFNAPIVSLCFNLDPTRSVVKATQRARNLRLDVNNSEKFAVIVEFLDKDFNKKTPPITFDQIINNRAIVVPSSWRNNDSRIKKIVGLLKPSVHIKDLNVKVTAKEVLKVTTKLRADRDQTWLPQEEVRKIFFKNKWKNLSEYDKKRPAGCPSSAIFPDHYGTSFNGVMYGKRKERNILWLPEEKVREIFLKNEWSGKIEYNEKKPDHCPTSQGFPNIYGKTFAEVMYPLGKHATEKEVRKVFFASEWKSRDDYNKNRPANFPNSNHFLRIYGKPFSTVIRDKEFTHKPKNEWPSPSKIKKLFREKGWETAKQYNANRPAGYPNISEFLRIYKKNFTEIIYGKKTK
jgi:superfamily II DNA or RNA helicase